MIHLFDSSDKKKIKTHLNNIIYIASLDGHIDDDEKKCILKIAGKFNVTEDEVLHLIEDKSHIEYHVPVDLEERFEFLYDLMMMIKVDNKIEESELKIFKYMVINLHFDLKKVDEIVNFFIKETNSETDPELMFKDLKKVLLS
jgi:uncharacterized tellurite resistance protein B-like protein